MSERGNHGQQSPPPWDPPPGAGQPPRPAAAPAPNRTRRAALAILLLALLLVVTDVSAVIGHQTSPTSNVASGTPATLAPGPSGPTTTTVPASTTPSGFTRYQVPAQRFSIAVPTAWTRLNPSSPAAKAVEPNGVGPSSSSYKFEATDGHGSVVGVVVISVNGDDSSALPDAVNSFDAGAEKAGATIVDSRSLTLDRQPADQVDYESSTASAGGSPVNVNQTAYLLIADGNFYAINLTGPNGQLPQVAHTFDAS